MSSKKKTASKSASKSENNQEAKVTKKKETKKERKEREVREAAQAEAAFVTEVLGTSGGNKVGYPDILAPTPRIPFQQVLASRRLDVLGLTENTRIASEVEENAQQIMLEIKAEGLLLPILVNENKALKQDGKPLGPDNPMRLRGDCRRRAIEMGYDAYPEAFTAMFGPREEAMIPVYVIECDLGSAMKLINDHGEHRPLGHAIECKRMCWGLLGSGMSKKDVIVTQATTLAKFSKRVQAGRSESWKQAVEYRKLAADLAAVGRDEAAAENLKKADKAATSAFWGQLQDREREQRIPWAVDAITYHEGGKMLPKGSPLQGVEFIPTLTVGLVKELARVFDAECQADRAFSKRNPGPKFKAAWSKIVADQKGNKKSKKKGTTGRSRSAAKLREEANTVGLSQGIAAALHYAANTGDDDERKQNHHKMLEADRFLNIVQDAITYHNSEWTTLVKLVEDGRDEREKQSAQEATSAADEVEAA